MTHNAASLKTKSEFWYQCAVDELSQFSTTVFSWLSVSRWKRSLGITGSTTKVAFVEAAEDAATRCRAMEPTLLLLAVSPPAFIIPSSLYFLIRLVAAEMSEEIDGLAALESKLRAARINCELEKMAGEEIEGGAFAALFAVLGEEEEEEDSSAASTDAKDKVKCQKFRPRFARAAELLSELLAWCPTALSRDAVISCVEAVCTRVERASREENDGGGDAKQVLAFGCHVLWVVAGAFRDRHVRGGGGGGGDEGEEGEGDRVDKLEASCLRAATAASRHACFKARVEAKAQAGSGRFRFGLGVAARAVARLRQAAEAKEEGVAAAAAAAAGGE